MKVESAIHFCDFCGKHEDFVQKIIVGKGSCICNECVELCVEIITEGESNGEQEQVCEQAGNVQAQ